MSGQRSWTVLAVLASCAASTAIGGPPVKYDLSRSGDHFNYGVGAQYQSFRASLKALLQTVPKEECAITGEVRHSCVPSGLGELEGGPMWYLVPPLPAVPSVPHPSDTISHTYAGVYSSGNHRETSIFAPIGMVQNGRAALQQLRAAASEGRTECSGNVCRLFVNGYLTELKGATAIAVCSAHLLAGKSFPVLSTCTILSVDIGGETWLRAISARVDGDDGSVPSAISMPGMRLELLSSSKRTDVIDRIGHGVAQPPLSLQTDKSGSVLRAFADWRNSTVIPHHKEQIEITFDFVEKGSDNATGRPVYYFELIVNPEILLSWRPIYDERAPPTEEEQVLYRSAILSAIASSLAPVCEVAGPQETTTFTCQ